jgi:hypothetical protein
VPIYFENNFLTAIFIYSKILGTCVSVNMKEQRRHTVQCLFNEYQKGHRARDAKKKICQENRSNFMPDSTINYWYSYSIKVTSFYSILKICV